MATGRFDYELRANASGFTSEVHKAERSVQQLEKAQKGAAESSANWTKAAAATAAGIAAVAAAGTLALRKVVQETSESERVMAQLNATLKSTGGVSGKTAAELAATASSLQKLTTYGDEAIISAQSLLLTFKNVRGDNFDRTTRAILDMSTALGTDLKSSALQLGKALENPTKGISALTRSGVSFSEAQKDVIKGLAETGRLAEAQTLILAELETQFGGSAEAARNTMGGALLALQNSWGELFEMQQTASQGMTDSVNALNATISDPSFKAAMDTVIHGLIDVVNWATKGAAAIVYMFQVMAGTQNQGLVDLSDRIDEVTKSLASMERQGRGNSLAAQKNRAVLADLKKQYAELEASIIRASKPVEKLSPILVTAEQRTVKLAAANVSLAKSCDTVAASVDDLSPIIVNATRKTVDLGKTTEEVAVSTSGVWDDVRSTLSGMFFEMAADGQNAFDVLVNGFKAMLAKMIAEAAANRILLAIGVGGTSAGATAGTAAASAGGGGSILSGLSALGGNITAGGQALYEGIGNILSNSGMTKLGDMAYTKGLNTTGLSIGLDIGGGLVGGYLGNKAFGQTSGLGAAAGGIAGSILIPIPGVGAAVGSFLGSGVESLFGGKNNGNNRGFTNFNLATGANVGGGIGKSFDQGNVDTATGLAATLQQFAAAIGGSSLAGNITVGKGKIQYGGKSFSSASDFLSVAYVDVMRGANLATNVVTESITAFTTTQKTAMESYRQGTDDLLKQIDAFDGAHTSAERLASAMQLNKQAAYEFATAIQTIGRALGVEASSQANAIRESVMSPQQLLDKRQAEGAYVSYLLGRTTDPEKAAMLTQQYLQLNRQVFDSITPEQQRMYAGDFAANAENANAVAQRVIENSLSQLKATQDQVNEKFSAMLQASATTQQRAADTQLQAANIMLQAAQQRGLQVAV